MIAARLTLQTQMPKSSACLGDALQPYCYGSPMSFSARFVQGVVTYRRARWEGLLRGLLGAPITRIAYMAMLAAAVGRELVCIACPAVVLSA